MHYNIIKTAAGARTRLRLPMLWHADAVAAEELPEAVFWVFIGGERVRVEKTPGSDDEYIFPELQAGQYAWDLVVDAQVVLHGVLKVRGSAVPPGGGEVCGTLLVDAPAMVLVLSPGPRGEVGPQGVQGFSAYEVARQHGYEGSEADWAEELSGAQAAATEAKEQAKAAAGSATTAGEQARAAAGSATTAGEQARAAAGSATTAGEQAKAAAGSATTAGEQAKAAAGSATTAGEQAKAAADSADTAGEQAKAAAGSATTASQSADKAAATLAGAAQVGANNEFTATNTFNGALVANGSLLYEQQELGDLLNYPVAAWLLENGLHPASALAKSWDEWVGLNPGWESMESLLFYAPLMQGESIPAFENINTPFSQCTFISPANVSNSNSQYLLSKNITLYSLKEGSCGDVYNCYNVKKCFFYVPKVTEFRHALNAVGYSNLGVELELSIYAPQLRDIYLNGINTSFWRLGLLKSFSIYAPELKKSFDFSRRTNKLDASNYHIGQTCAILHKLIEGIGAPDKIDPDTGLETEPQTITTLPPSDGDEVQTVDDVEKTNLEILVAAAAAKHWQFDFVPYQQPSS